jgi:hypothetical protein
MGGTLTRDEWFKLGGPEEPEPDRVCSVCERPLGKWMIAYPVDPGERGVLCVMCWRSRLSNSSDTDASQPQSNPH